MKFIRWCSLVASISALLASSAHANDDWWFDVEVIAFKRNTSLSELEEQFTLADSLNAPRADADVIRDIIAPDISWLKQGLRKCDVDTRPTWPAYPMLDVPDSDVDFLSLPPLVLQQDTALQEGLSHDELIQKDPFQGDVSQDTLLQEPVSDITEANSDATENGITDGPNALTGLATAPLDTTAIQMFEEPSTQEIPNISEQATLSTEQEDTFDTALLTEGGDTLFAADNNLAPADTDALSAVDDTESVIEAVEEIAVPSELTIAQYWLSFFGTDVNAGKQPLFENEKAQSAEVFIPAFAYCETPQPWLTVVEQNESIVWKTDKADNRLPAPSDLPIIIEGHDWPRASRAHLLSSEQQSLASISRQIRSNRDLERLFHATWRQPVAFGKDNAFNVRLYGGKNYSSEFRLTGEQRPQQRPMPAADVDETTSIDNLLGNSVDALASDTIQSEELYSSNNGETRAVQGQTKDLFSTLDEKLAAPAPIDFNAFKALDMPKMFAEDDDSALNDALRTPIWEIDGTMKVFLKYINRVPYLHIDSALYYRQPVPLSYFSNSDVQSDDQALLVNTNSEDARASANIEYRLASVPLSEQRRVISTQLHYFDHPLFGFIVQIRRYKRPAIEDAEL